MKIEPNTDMQVLWFARIWGALLDNITTAAFLFKTQCKAAALRPLWLHQLQQWILTHSRHVLRNKSAKWLICAAGVFFLMKRMVLITPTTRRELCRKTATEDDRKSVCKVIKLYLTEALTCTPSVHQLQLTFPVMADQTFSVLSSEPLTMRLPQNWRQVITWSSWPFRTFEMGRIKRRGFDKTGQEGQADVEWQWNWWELRAAATCFCCCFISKMR